VELAFEGDASGHYFFMALRGNSIMQEAAFEVLGNGQYQRINVANGGFRAGDAFVFAECTRHLDNAAYSLGANGAITGTCYLNGVSIVRTSSALQDAQQTQQGVRVEVQITADNGGSEIVELVFAPNDTQQNFNLNLDDYGICSAVSDVTILSVTIA
jgi:hypothetical protein